MAKVVVVDVTDDYRFCQPTLPKDYYPVLAEMWVPRYRLSDDLCSLDFVSGYLYDWHESPEDDVGAWYVGVVDGTMVRV